MTSTNHELKYEEIAKLAQRYLSLRPVVVLGTGTTIPHGLPSMAALADKLLAITTDIPEGWEAFASRLGYTKDLEQTLQDVNIPQGVLERLVRETWKFISDKDIKFYQQLLVNRSDFPLSDLFAYLLRTADAHIRVVTTNYDRVAEYAANVVRAYASTGITAGWIQRFVSTSVNNERMPAPGYEGQVTILKVHGSLDWFRDGTGELVAIPLAQEVPDGMTPLIVTPGASKYREVQKDPFRTIMSVADDVLKHAACYVCIGYGFNDDDVQPILINRVKRENIPLVIITKTMTTQTRDAFLAGPPRHFLFAEEASEGTRVYTPDTPGGVVLPGIHVWRLQDFMEMITGEEGS